MNGLGTVRLICAYEAVMTAHGVPYLGLEDRRRLLKILLANGVNPQEFAEALRRVGYSDIKEAQ